MGIHTGGVLLGGEVDAEGTIRGIAVNIAACMEQTAPPRALRISHDTCAQVCGLFDVDVQAPLLVKGVDEPVTNYLVQRAKPRRFRLGKSRLLYEFAAWIDARPERFLLFRGRATPATGPQAYGPLRDFFAWRFQIADADSVATARRKLEKGIVPLFVDNDGPDLAERHAHLLGHLIGVDWTDSRHLRGILDDPKQIRHRAFHAAAQLHRPRPGCAGGCWQCARRPIS